MRGEDRGGVKVKVNVRVKGRGKRWSADQDFRRSGIRLQVTGYRKQQIRILGEKRK
jgi:hypothetical protein